MSLKVERLDHLPVIAGTIRELGLIEKIDALIPPHEDEQVTTGQAIAAMIICGLGFLHKPLSLTEQFFENRPIGFLLGNEELESNYFNRFKLGRELENVSKYGVEALFAQVAAQVCVEQAVETQTLHGDTTSFSFSGEYENEDVAVKITHGYSKDHRPDLKQIVLEMAVSQDGGVPILMAPWSGNTNDSEIFHQRFKQVKENFTVPPGLLVYDSKAYSKRNQVWFKHLNFVSRVPATYAAHAEWVKTALDLGNWLALDETEEKFWQEFEQDGERWIVVYSKAGQVSSRKNLAKSMEKESKGFEKTLSKLKRERFACEEDGKNVIAKQLKKLKYHKVKTLNLEPQTKYSGPGRPKKESTKELDHWRLSVLEIERDEDKLLFAEEEAACYILATNTKEMSATEVVRAYSQQSNVERGFRFLKDPQFFTSSMFLKKPERIQGLLLVMTLALLVYSLAERKLRASLKENKETLPNQIKQQTSTPTLRWVFQMLDGINRVHLELAGQPKQCLIEGLNENKKKAVTQFWKAVRQYYQIFEEVPCSM